MDGSGCTRKDGFFQEMVTVTSQILDQFDKASAYDLADDIITVFVRVRTIGVTGSVYLRWRILGIGAQELQDGPP